MALIKIDLTEQLGEGQYVEIRDPKHLPWGEQRKLQSSLKDESMDSQLAFAEQLAITLVKNGNVFDEDTNAITFPLTTDSVINVPAVVIDEVAKKFTEIKSQGVNLPKK